MIVLDASAWLNVLTGGLDLPLLGHVDLCVPPHFDVEAIGSLRAMQQRGWASEAQADAAIERHLSGAFWRTHDAADIRQAWHWRDVLSFRDAWYAALALRLGADWVTADRKAATTSSRLGVATQVV